MTRLNKIIFHWTAGTYFPNATDRLHYHFLIDKNGKVYNGVYKPEDNENCNVGGYAAHTGGGNTGAIGIGFCGMCGFRNMHNIGNYPLTGVQVERGFKLGAELCQKYGIQITPETVLTHYEFGLKHPKTTSAGKIDIIYLPSYPDKKPNEIGNLIRNKVKYYLLKLPQ